MRDIDFCELSVEQEEYLVELLCTRGACTLDLFARELDELCRENASAACVDPGPVDGPVVLR
jgi:hypothetical protein